MKANDFIQLVADQADFFCHTAREAWGDREGLLEFINEKIGNKINSFPEEKLTPELAERTYAQLKALKLMSQPNEHHYKANK